MRHRIYAERRGPADDVQVRASVAGSLLLVGTDIDLRALDAGISSVVERAADGCAEIDPGTANVEVSAGPILVQVVLFDFT